MPQRVSLPDGSIGEFPDGMSQDQIQGVLQKQFPKQPDAPKQPEFYEPHKDESKWGISNFLRGGAGAVAGVVKDVTSLFQMPSMGGMPPMTTGKSADAVQKAQQQGVKEQGEGVREQVKQARENPAYTAGSIILPALATHGVAKAMGIGPEARANKLAFASGPETTDPVRASMPDLQKAAAGSPPKTVGEYVQTIDKAKGALNNEYAQSLGPHANQQTMPTAISQKIRGLITDNMKKTAAGKQQIRAIENAALEFEKPWTLGELDSERMEANSRLTTYENKSMADQYSTLKKSRSVAIDKAIADGVRETVYPQMDKLTGKPPGYFANLKQRVGNLMELESKVDKQVKGLRDKTARIKGAPALSRGQVTEGAGSAAAGYKHGALRTLGRALVPENPEATASKRVKQAFKPNPDPVHALPITALAGGEAADQPDER